MAILGIDEVGRGPLAGPLVVGAVILPEEKPEWVSLLRDSKKLSAKKREYLAELILAEAPAGITIFVSAAEIDKLGISGALRKAMHMAVKSVQRLHVAFSEIVIDGNVNYLAGTTLEKYVTTLVKGDDLIREVSAGSIIAKVARDRYMTLKDAEFPGYGFAKNVGYGTKEHREAISRLGVCSEHRLSFEPCKSLVSSSQENSKKAIESLEGLKRKNTTEIGKKGEEAVCRFLIDLGHEVIARNFRTKFYEVDIISIFKGEIYFTEVKYRKNAEFGGAFSAIDEKKVKQMQFAAKSFLHFNKGFLDYEPKLAIAGVQGEDFKVLDWYELGV